jgi:hypothetical protein
MVAEDRAAVRAREAELRERSRGIALSLDRAVVTVNFRRFPFFGTSTFTLAN